MSHFLNDLVVDVALNYLKNNVTRIVLCAGAPASYSEADTNNGTGSGKKLSQTPVTSSEFTLADDVTNGRKLTCAQLNGVEIIAAGNASHVAWLDVTNSALLKVAPLETTQSGLTTSSVVNIPATYHVFRDAQAVA
jgi:hypothetical protein